MTMKRLLSGILVPLLLLLCPAMLFSQAKTISGKVIDSKDGTPISGVSVVPKGSTKGTVTAADGSFSLTVNNNVTTLVFSYVGFASMERPANGTNVSVSLTAFNAAMNEVVIVGYGTAKKKDLTGSITTVSAKDFQKGSITTPEQMIAGKVAGVSIISNSGQPGSGSTIRIRGGSSLNASNDPLIVVDGVPLDESGISGAGNGLSFINSNDIESFTVLKDASAAAIYGTRASNGVIIITTKKGKGGKLKVEFSSVNSISKNIKNVEVLSADQIRSIVNANGTAAQKAMLGTANTNWQNEIYRAAFATDNNISISGGLKNLPYRISIGYQNQDGVLKTDNLQKESVALVFNPTFFDNHLKVDINLKGSMENTLFADQGAIGNAISFDPTQQVYNPKSTRFNGYYEWLDPTTATGLNALAGKNPVGILHEGANKGTPERSIGNIQFDYKFHFLPELHANLNLGYDIAEGKGTTFVSDSAANGYLAGGTGGSNNHYKQTQTNTLLDFYLNYAKDFKSIKSRVDITAGYSYNDYLYKYYNYASYNAQGVKYPSTDPTYPFDKPEHTLLSYFGRAVYAFEDKYLLTATIRRDGSSRFGPDHKWGLFPSVAFAWKIKDESFLKNSGALSDLKLRVGYGITGQQDGIANFAYLASYSLSNLGAAYQLGNSYYQGYRPSGYNPQIKWEQTATSNIALDYGFFDNRISGSVDFYYKNTTDLLNSIPAPAGTNFSAYVLSNVGSMSNKGVEFSINLVPVKTRDITWDVSFNATYNKNNITNLTVLPDDPNYLGFPSTNISGVQGFAFLNAVGTPKNTFYLYKQIYGKDGKPIEGLFEDKNRDGILNEDDKYKGKQADPKTFFGFSTDVSYKKWNAGFVLRASFGNYVYNNVYSNNGRLNQIIGGSVIGNASVSYLQTGFKGNTDQQLLSDYYVQNASFLRMDNVNIGYNIGRIFNNKATLRTSITAQNVFVITKYKGLDPEISSGVDNTVYPRPRVLALGLNLGF
jgi:TonB-dependent starch-binding outer membrane protein SusC